jgi:CheY-like chemotaxis protein
MKRENFSILVVDDDASTRYSIARSLRAAGYKTMEAASGSEALQFAEYVSAVILDIHLPDLLGWEVCRLLRSRLNTAHLPVINITAKYTAPEDKAQSLESGADAYFAAPIDMQKLLEELDGLLSK